MRLHATKLGTRNMEKKHPQQQPLNPSAQSLNPKPEISERISSTPNMCAARTRTGFRGVSYCSYIEELPGAILVTLIQASILLPQTLYTCLGNFAKNPLMVWELLKETPHNCYHVIVRASTLYQLSTQNPKP